MAKIGNKIIFGERANEVDNAVNLLKQDLDDVTRRTQESILETFQTDLFVHTDKTAEQIKQNREHQIESGRSEIGRIELYKGQSGAVSGGIGVKKYQEFYDKYNNVIQDISLSEEDREKKLEDLDNDLAAKIILDSSVSSVSH